jgi:hypothetical protein
LQRGRDRGHGGSGDVERLGALFGAMVVRISPKGQDILRRKRSLTYLQGGYISFMLQVRHGISQFLFKYPHIKYFPRPQKCPEEAGTKSSRVSVAAAISNSNSDSVLFYPCLSGRF